LNALAIANERLLRHRCVNNHFSPPPGKQLPKSKQELQSLFDMNCSTIQAVVACSLLFLFSFNWKKEVVVKQFV
jgi:hypothetical protein